MKEVQDLRRFGFRVWGLGFRVQDLGRLGFRAWGLGVQDLGRLEFGEKDFGNPNP